MAIDRRGGAPLSQIAKDFGISDSCRRNWIRAANVEDGNRPGTTATKAAELRELRRRNRPQEQENEILRHAAAYLSQANLPGKALYPVVSELAADGFPVAVTCRIRVLARQPHYRWLATPITTREVNRAYLADAVSDAHRKDLEFSYRLLADEVCEAGQLGCDRTVWRICADNSWWAAFEPPSTNGKRPGPPAHEDRVRRGFTARAPNRLWVADIERHEALTNPAVMEGHRRWSVAADR